MATQTTALLGHALREALGPGVTADRQLLERFVRLGDEAAFAALVRQHGPAVFGVCRRILGHRQDAEDAFQATFLVLARKAASVPWRGSIRPWLCEVARRAAGKARTARARRRHHEGEAGGRPVPDPHAGEVGQAVAEEIARLPSAYRTALARCLIEGRSAEEACRELGCSPGALRGRLHRGRALLRERLARRGIAPAPLLGAGTGLPLAPPPARLAEATVRICCQGVGRAPPAGANTAQVMLLTEGVLRAMRTTKWKIAAGALLAVALGGLAAGLLHPRLAAEPPAASGPREERRAGPNPAGEDRGEREDRWQDLLATIDPDRHTVGKGIWRLKGGTLIGYPAAHGARLRVPIIPSGDYELRARWEPRTGDSSVAFIIPHGDKMAAVEVMPRFGCAGLGDLNGVRADINETRTELKVEPGKAYDVSIRVRVKGPQVHVLAKVGDKTVVDWEGKRTELEHEFFAPPKPASLGLAVGGNASTFHSFQLRMLDGKAQPWRAAPGEGGR